MGRNGSAARVAAAARAIARGVGPDGALGLAAAALIGAGAWALGGWPAAALSVGVPLGAFYLYAEARKLGGMKEE